MKQFRFILLVVLLVFAVSLVAAHDAPTVEVSDQVSLNGWVTVSHVTSDGPGFMVIHKDNGEGGIGAVIGYRWVNDGESNNVNVKVDLAEATSTLFAMLHVDTGVVGMYEFGTVEGADGPVVIDGAPVSPSFVAEIMVAYDQFLDGSNVTVANVVTAQNGFVVIHADNGGQPGPVLGQTAVAAGTNWNVAVELSGDITPVVWPMLHVDTGEVGVYEFGTVEGADGPVRVNDAVLTFAISIAPSITYTGTLTGTTLVVSAAQIDQQGWLVIHADNGGQPGPVLGYAPLVRGVNGNITIELSGDVTAVVYPMLHVDSGEAGVYEFGTVEGADGPVRVADAVVTGPMTPEAGE